MTSAVVLVTTGATDGGAAGLLPWPAAGCSSAYLSDHTFQTSVTYAAV